MAYVYSREGSPMWWYRIKAGGRWISKRSDFRVDDPHGKRKAKRYADGAQRKTDAKPAGAPACVGPLTVRAYVGRDPRKMTAEELQTSQEWLAKRYRADLDWTNDASRLHHHVLKMIGDLPIADVRAKHVRDLVHRWRFVTKLAPRSVYNIYSVVSAMFRDAALDGEIEQTPCILTKQDLGSLVDKNPEWRHGAVYTRDEAEILISHAEIPLDRRIFYAFGLLAGMRPGEITAVRFADHDASAEPLGRLTIARAYAVPKGKVKSTKTEAVRRVPVHPTLAAMLAEWKLSGWAAMMGRAPTPDDLILPLPPADVGARRSRTGEAYRTGDYAARRWRDVDLPMLGWRHRELYATKSTFITVAIEDGADRDVIRDRITHAKPRRDAFDGYDRGPHWLETCREISKLRLVRRSPDHVTGHVTVGDFSNERATLLGAGEGIRTLDVNLGKVALYH